MDLKTTTHLADPCSDIVPADAHDVAALERPPAVVCIVSQSIFEQISVTETEVVDETGVDAFCDLRYIGGWSRGFASVSANKAFVSLAHYPSFAAPVSISLCLTEYAGRRT